MNTKHKIIASIMLIIFVNSLVFIFLANLYFNRQINDFIETQTKSTQAIVSTIEQHSFQKYKSRIQAVIKRLKAADNGAALHALKHKQREKLAQLANPFLEILQTQNQYFSGFAFILPNNINFLRVHNLELFDDDVSQKRQDIVDTNRDHRQHAGYNVAGINLVYSIVEPIFFQDEYLGALQFAISGRQLFETIKNELNIPVALLVPAEKSNFIEQSKMDRVTSGSFSIFSPEIDFFKETAPHIDWNLERQTISMDGKSLIIIKVLDLKNHKGQLQGEVVVGLDISEKIAEKKSNFRLVVFVCLFFLLLSLIISNKGYDALSRLVMQKNIDLRRSAQRYQLVATNTSDLIYEMDLKTKNFTWFGDIETLLGYSITTENEWYEAIHPEDRENSTREYKKLLDGTIDHFSVQFRIKHNDGSWCIWSENGNYITDETGQPSLWIGACSDITVQIAAEKERARLVTAIDQSSETVVITDLNGTIQYVNPAFEKLTGYDKDEVIGQNPRVLSSGKHDVAFYEKMWDTLLQGNTWKGHLINKKKDGSLFEEEATVSPVKNEAGNVTNFVAVKRDVTHEISLEKQLRQAMKMEAIGTLAGGIAHDFNNILSAILGYTEIAKAQLPADNKIRNDLDQVIIAGQRATDLVKQILTFSRQSEELFKPLDVQVILTEVLKLLRSSLPSTISLKENISKDCDMVFANSTQIHQVIMNICTNAKDAIGEEIGTLEVSLSEIQFTKTNDIATYPQMANGSYLDIEIRDTGCGMNSSTQAKIFDPFYTTKERGKGTGIGLAVVHGIIKQHKGEITVTSEPGHGTTFHIYLPVIEHQETLEEQVVSQKLPLGNGERILFVDDEVSIISMMQITLSNLGYSVTVFDSSLEAFDAYQQNPEYFDIIITDMTMPQMTGLEMSKKLLEIQPDLPIILCTGFSETIDNIKAKSFGISAFINKPIHQLTLAKTIQKVLKKPEKA